MTRKFLILSSWINPKGCSFEFARILDNRSILSSLCQIKLFQFVFDMLFHMLFSAGLCREPHAALFAFVVIEHVQFVHH